MGQEQSTLDAGAPNEVEPQRGAAQPRVAGSVPHVLRWPHGGKTAYICGSFTHWQKVPMHWQQVGAAGEWVKMLDLTPGTHQYKFIIDGQWRHDHTASTVLDNLGNVNNCIQISATRDDGPPPAPSTGAAAGVGTPAGAAAAAAAGGVGGAGAAAAAAAAAAGGGGGGAGAGADASAAGGGMRRGGAGGSSTADRCASDPYLAKTRSGAAESYGQVVPPREELLVHHAATMLLPPQLRLLLPHHHGDAHTMPLSVQMHHAFCHFEADVAVFAVRRHRARARVPGPHPRSRAPPLRGLR